MTLLINSVSSSSNVFAGDANLERPAYLNCYTIFKCLDSENVQLEACAGGPYDGDFRKTDVVLESCTTEECIKKCQDEWELPAPPECARTIPL